MTAYPQTSGSTAPKRQRSNARIMYIENKSGGLTGGARIGRVTFSRTGCTLYYRDQSFQSLKGYGFKANYFETVSGDHYWISGPSAMAQTGSMVREAPSRSTTMQERNTGPTYATSRTALIAPPRKALITTTTACQKCALTMTITRPAGDLCHAQRLPCRSCA